MALGSVSKVRRADELGALAHGPGNDTEMSQMCCERIYYTDLHLRNSLIPATDHFALAHGEAEGLAASPGRIKDLSISQGAGVVNDGSLATLWEGDTWKMGCWLVICTFLQTRRGFSKIRDYSEFTRGNQV